jgi:hypothetical protein
MAKGHLANINLFLPFEEVAGDELELRDWLADNLGVAFGHIAVARAVEAVFADFVVLVPLIRNREHI